MDIARLGIQVESGSVPTAESRLDGLTASSQRTQAATSNLTRQTASMNQSIGVSANRFRQLGLQLNQVAQVGGMTGNWMNAVAVQLPDILLSFGTLGIYAGIAAGALIPLLANMQGVQSTTERLTADLDALSDALQAQTAISDRLRDGIGGLVEQYGRFAREARVALEIQELLAYENSVRSLGGAIETITTQFGEFSETSEQVFEESSRGARRNDPEFVKLADTLGISVTAAAELRDEFIALEKAAGPEAQAQALLDLAENIRNAARSAGDMNLETSEIVRMLLEGSLLAFDLAGGIGEAADQAARLSQNLLISSGRGGDPRQFDTESRFSDRFVADSALLAQTDEFMRGPRRGRSGAGRSGVDREEAANQRAAEQIFDRTRTAAERYAIEVAELQELAAAGYFGTEPETAEIMARAMAQLQDELHGTSLVATQVGNGFSGMFADFVTGASSAQNAALGLLNTLSNMVVNSAFQTFLQPGVDQIVGGFFGGFRAEGGPVSGGMAYMVGERGPEMFVPTSPGAIVPNHALGFGGTQRVVIELGAGLEARMVHTARQGAATDTVQIVQASSQARDTSFGSRSDAYSERYG